MNRIIIQVAKRLVVASVISAALSLSVARAGNADASRVIAGPDKAAVTIEEFADFQCGYCGTGSELVKRALKDYDGKVNLVFRNLPLSFHNMALPAAKAFAAVQLQRPDLAYAFYNKLFENQSRLVNEGMPFLVETAKAIGADAEQMKSDMNGEKVAQVLAEDRTLADTYKFKGTPSFRIGTESVTGAVPYAEFKKTIEQQLKTAGSM